MAQNLNPIEPVKVVQPSVDFETARNMFTVFIGGEESYQQITSSQTSQSNFFFSQPRQGSDVCIVEQCYIGIPIQADFVGTSTGSYLLNDGYDAFRAYPFQSICTSTSLNIGNVTTSIVPKDVIHELDRYGFINKGFEGSFTSMAPTFPDCFQEYSDGVGTLLNPLGSLYSATPNNWQQVPRGAYPIINCTNTPTTASFQAMLFEPIVLPPLTTGDNRSALSYPNIQIFNLTFQMKNDNSYMWSHAAGLSTITSARFTFGQPYLFLKLVSPHASMINKSISVQNYAYTQILYNPNDALAPLAPNASTQMNIPNYTLSSVPNSILLCVKENENYRTISSTDTWQNISSVIVKLGTRDGILSSAKVLDIFNICKKNGATDDIWPLTVCTGVSASPGGLSNIGISGAFGSHGQAFHPLATRGTVLRLMFGSDIPLPPDLAIGSECDLNLQVTVNYTNINQSRSLYLTASMVIVQEGIFSINHNITNTSTVVLTKEDVVLATREPGVSYQDVITDWSSGGAFSFKRLIKSLPSFYRGVRKGIRAVGSVPKSILKESKGIAKDLGLNEARELAQYVSGSEIKPGAKAGAFRGQRSPYQRRLSYSRGGCYDQPCGAGLYDPRYSRNMRGGQVIQPDELENELEEQLYEDY